MTSAQIARVIGRTAKAVTRRRAILRRAEEHGAEVIVVGRWENPKSMVEASRELARRVVVLARRSR